jgi:hypothetical protein
MPEGGGLTPPCSRSPRGPRTFGVPIMVGLKEQRLAVPSGLAARGLRWHGKVGLETGMSRWSTVDERGSQRPPSRLHS